MENGINMCDYISNEELNAKIEELENTYSSNDLVKIGSIGKSVLVNGGIAICFVVCCIGID